MTIACFFLAGACITLGIMFVYQGRILKDCIGLLSRAVVLNEDLSVEIIKLRKEIDEDTGEDEIDS